MAMQIRIDRDNHKRLAKAARENRRSVAQEGNKIIADYFRQPKILIPDSLDREINLKP
jgi:hypothetical protein